MQNYTPHSFLATRHVIPKLGEERKLESEEVGCTGGKARSMAVSRACVRAGCGVGWAVERNRNAGLSGLLRLPLEKSALRDIGTPEV